MLRLAALCLVLARVVVLCMRLDIFDTIAGAFNAITSIPGDVVRTIYNAIKSVWGFFAHVAEVLDSAWDWMVNGVEWLGSRAEWLGGAAFNVLTWLTTRWIPMAAHWALGQAVAYAIGAVKQVERWVSSLVAGAVRILRGLINTVEHWARTAFRAVTGEIGKLITWTVQAGKYVFGILAHPQRLVAWIIPDLLVPLLKFLVSSSAPVVRWLIGAAAHLLPELATTLEDAISKLI